MRNAAVTCHPKALWTAVAVAAVLWFLMFSPWTAPLLPFWWCMTASACILSTLALTQGGSACLGSFDGAPLWKQLIAGVLIAAALWLVFFIGDKVSQWMFSFARPQVNLIYDMKDDSSPLLLSLLMLCVIGPAEEVFWRGYVQRSLTARLSPTWAFVLTTAIYALVHLPSGNFMLIMAALTCGIIWGGLYRLFPQWLPAIILSHALWDAAAFVWFPF